LGLHVPVIDLNNNREDIPFLFTFQRTFKIKTVQNILHYLKNGSTTPAGYAGRGISALSHSNFYDIQEQWRIIRLPLYLDIYDV